MKHWARHQIHSKISRAWLAGVTFQPAEGKIQAGTCGNLPDPTCSSWNSSPAVLSPASPVTQGTLCGFSVSLRDLPASGPPALVPPSEGRHFLSPIHWALLPTPFLSSSAHLIWGRLSCYAEMAAWLSTATSSPQLLFFPPMSQDIKYFWAYC